MYVIYSTADKNSSDLYYTKEWGDVNCPMHCHYTLEIVFVTTGTLTIRKEDKTYTLTQNQAIIMMPFEKHKFDTKNQSRILVTEISPKIISNFDILFKNKTPQNPIAQFSEKEMSDICDHMKHSKNNPIEINCLFYLIMSKMLRNNELIISNKPDDLLRKAIIYMNDHFEENITLKDVASSLNVSYVYLSRVFSEKSSMKFTDILNSMRLYKATTLLCDTQLSISEICYSCGWGSLRNFNRVFWDAMSCTPNQFRQKSLNAENRNPFYFYE